MLNVADNLILLSRAGAEILLDRGSAEALPFLSGDHGCAGGDVLPRPAPLVETRPEQRGQPEGEWSENKLQAQDEYRREDAAESSHRERPPR